MVNRRGFVKLGSLTAVLGVVRDKAGANNSALLADAKSNGEPKTFSRFTRLPGGSVVPAGWLQEYAHLNANGWVLKQVKDELPSVWGRYVHRTSNPKPAFTANDEWKDPPDYGIYFGESLVHLGLMKAGPEVEEAAHRWVDQHLKSQDPDGYIGAFTPEARWQYWLSGYYKAHLLDTLLFYHESTGDAKALKACERLADLILKVWYGPDKRLKRESFGNLNAIILRPMGKMYLATGNPRYRDFGREILDRYGWTDGFLSSKNRVRGEHDVIASQHVGHPITVYEYTGDAKLKQASEAGFKMMQRFLAVDGSPHGNEMIFQVGSRVNCEHCGAVEWMTTARDLARVTGEVKYADAVERAMFNAYPAPKMPDGMALAYMHSPNQLVATEWSKPHDNDGDQDYWGSRQYYSTAQEPLCCNSISARAIPFYVESMVQRSDRGLAVTYYGPCQASAVLPQAGKVSLAIDTRYPFEDEVRMTVSVDRSASFPIQLRVPGWCQSADIAVNGTSSTVKPAPGSFAVLERNWTSGDKVTVKFTNPIRVNLKRRAEFGGRPRIAIVERGPLVFSLPVPADFRPFPPPSHGPGKDIKAYRVFPTSTAVWNYAYELDAEHPERSLKLVHLPVPAGSRPWDSNPPIGLEVKARRILDWQMAGQPDYPTTPPLPRSPMKLASKTETVVLVPFGSTRLRITYLPVIPARS